MLGAYSAATLTAFSGSYVIGLLGAMLFMGLFGAVLEIVLIRRLYRHDHLTQVLATFALILIFNETVRILWGVQPRPYDMPAALSGSVPIVGDLRYSAYRLATIVAGVVVALLLYWMVSRTRVGMWVRAGASNREMVQMMGVNAGTFWSQMQGSVHLSDVSEGIIKSLAFGFACTLIAMYEGYNAAPTAEGVGLATTRTVVASAVLTLIIDYLLTAAFL
jgi:ABC-type uncharacterized transport system permease subunit